MLRVFTYCDSARHRLRRQYVCSLSVMLGFITPTVGCCILNTVHTSRYDCKCKWGLVLCLGHKKSLNFRLAWCLFASVLFSWLQHSRTSFIPEDFNIPITLFPCGLDMLWYNSVCVLTFHFSVIKFCSHLNLSFLTLSKFLALFALLSIWSQMLLVLSACKRPFFDSILSI